MLLYKNWHFKNVRKNPEANEIANFGKCSDTYPDMCAILLEEGYVGVLEFMRSILPSKMQPNGLLTLSHESENHIISSDYIIVENYFGRLCGLWNILSSKWRWK